MFSRMLLIPLIVLITASTAFSQNVTMQLVGDSEIEIVGTSNIHDWEAVTNTITAELILNGFDSTNLQDLTAENFQRLTLSLPVESLDTDRRGLTNNVHKYLKSDEFPTIRFELTRISEVQQSDNGVALVAAGTLHAAGQDLDVTMNVQAEMNSSGVLTFTGTQDMKMTDFNIDPPTALFGTVRAVDEISIVYNVKFQR